MLAPGWGGSFCQRAVASCSADRFMWPFCSFSSSSRLMIPSWKGMTIKLQRVKLLKGEKESRNASSVHS